MAKKIAYRVRNWKDYNHSLINRGNLTSMPYYPAYALSSADSQ